MPVHKSHSRLAEAGIGHDTRSWSWAAPSSGQAKEGEMSTRLILVVPTIFATCIVAVSLNMTSAVAVDECLAAPNATAPEGRHWYYRANKTTGNRCWYLAATGKKVRPAAAPVPVPARKPTAPPAQTGASVSVTPSDAAVGVTPPVAAPDDIVTIFSQTWPSAEKPGDTIGRAPTTTPTTVSSETKGAEVQMAPDEATPSVGPVVSAEPVRPVVSAESVRPVLSGESVRPVLSADEPARAQSSPAPSFQTDGRLPLIVGSLCLAGIVGLLGALAAVRLRQRRPVWTPGPAPWRSADSTPLGLRPGRDPDTGKTDLRRET